MDDYALMRAIEGVEMRIALAKQALDVQTPKIRYQMEHVLLVLEQVNEIFMKSIDSVDSDEKLALKRQAHELFCEAERLFRNIDWSA